MVDDRRLILVTLLGSLSVLAGALLGMFGIMIGAFAGIAIGLVMIGRAIFSSPEPEAKQRRGPGQSGPGQRGYGGAISLGEEGAHQHRRGA